MRHYAAAALLGLAGLLAAGEPTATDREDILLVYLGPKRPSLLRLAVRMEGQPYLDAWESAVARIHAALDADKDGVVTMAEAAALPPTELLSLATTPSSFKPLPGAPEWLDLDGDGRVSRAELAHFFHQRGAGPLRLRSAAPRSLSVTDVYGNPARSDALDKALFDVLDTDHDGKLSREELARGPALLAALDENEDELVSTEEMLAGEAGSAALDPAPKFVPSQDPGPAAFLLLDRQAPRKTAEALRARYEPMGRIKASDIGLDAATFARLDTNRNGELDLKELERFGQLPPDAEFEVHIDGRRANIRRKGAPEPPAATLLAVPQFELGFELDNAHFALRAATLLFQTPKARVDQSRRSWETTLRFYDNDRTGYLDRKKAAAIPGYSALFPLLDADSDGKLYPEEIQAYFQRIAPILEASLGGSLDLAIAEEGRGLFQLLDVNGDRQLCPRELRRLTNLLGELDQNRDGYLQPDELPQRFQLLVQPAASGTTVFGNRMPSNVRRSAPPAWFTHMDRNRDGDVSRREFLGTDEQFRRLDTDGDGLLSADEAIRAAPRFPAPVPR